MKKRIIAAMTALVMVVTMIPANAFAAEPDTPVTAARKAIAAAAFGSADAYETSGGDDCKDDYSSVEPRDESKALIEDAEAKYAALKDQQKYELETLWKANPDKTVSYNDLLVARAIYNDFMADKAAFQEAQKAVLDGETLEFELSSDSGSDPAIDVTHGAYKGAAKVLIDSYDRLADTSRYYGIKNGVAAELESADGAYVTATVADIKDTVTKDEKSTEIFGEDFDQKYVNFARAIAKVNAITLADVNKASIGNEPQAFTDAKSAITGDFSDMNTTKVEDYIMYAKNYNYYKAIEAKVEPAAEIQETIDLIGDGTANGVGDLSNDVVTTPDDVNAGTVIVKDGNIDAAKKLYKKVKEVYDKYAAMSEYDGQLDTLAEKVGFVKNHIDMYEKALTTRTNLENMAAKKELSLSDIALIKKVEAINTTDNMEIFQANENPYDILDFYFTEVGPASTELFNSLLAKIDIDLGGYTTTEIETEYATLLLKEINKVSTINALDYSKEEDAIMNVASLLREMKLLEVKNAPTIAEGDYDATIGAIAGANEFDPSDVSDAFAKILSDDVYAEFELKCEVLDAAAETNYDNALSTALAEALTNGVKDSTITAAEEAITTFKTGLTELTSVEKSVYEVRQAAKNEADQDINVLNELQRNIDAYKLSKTVKNEVNEVIAKIATLKTGADLTETQKASNEATLAEIETLFAKPGVQDTFFGEVADGEIDLEYNHSANSPVSSSYVNHEAIDKYLELGELNKEEVKLPEAVVEVINQFADLNETKNLDADIEAYLAAKTKFEALSDGEKNLVNNKIKYELFLTSIAGRIVNGITPEMDKIGNIGLNLDANQLKVVENVNKLLAKYETVLVDAGVYDPNGDSVGNMFKEPFVRGDGTAVTGSSVDRFYLALMKVDAENADKVIKEEIAPVYDVLNILGIDAGYDVKTADNVAYAKAIDTYNKLSDYAKQVLVRNSTKAAVDEILGNGASVETISSEELEAILKIENDIKSLVLDYATENEIKDVVEGSELPEIVLKDVKGNVIAKEAYVVAPESDLVVGENTLIITPAKDSRYAGIKKVKFNVVPAKPAAPTGLKVVDSDQGVLKIVADTVKDAQYKFYVKKVGDTKWTSSKLKNTPEVTFYGLTKNAKYQVKAVVLLNDEYSDATIMDGTYWTNRVGTKAAAMYKPSIKSVTIKNRVAKITVNKVDYNKAQYALGFKKGNAKNFKWFDPNAKTVKTLKNLKKGVKYTFAIKYQYTSEVSGTIIKSNGASKTVTKVAK